MMLVQRVSHRMPTGVGSGRLFLRERGMVTIEVAIGVVSLVMLAAFLAWGVMLGMTQAKCVEVASQVARLTSRGDIDAARRAQQQVPAGSRISVTTVDGYVVAVVSIDQSFLGWGSVALSGKASFPQEPGS